MKRTEETQAQLETINKANARLIVKAVNERDELIEALKSVAQLRASIITWSLGNRIPGWQSADDLFKHIDEALQRAESEEGE